MTAPELRALIALADRGGPINADLALAMLAALTRDALRALLTDAGVECIRPGQSKNNMLTRARLRLTARERSELRNSC